MVPAGPRPLRDDNLMVVAATMMQRSLDAGKNDVHVQYDTVRQFWSAVHNQWRASDEGQAASVMMRGTTKLMTSTCPTNGEWFERFMLGFHKRVGGVSRPDLAVSIEVMLALMQRFDRLWILAEGDSKKQQEVLFPALLAVAAYAGGLRGEEVPLMDLFSMFKHFAEGMNHLKHPHVVMALRGRFKNEIGELEHLKPLVTKTRSGLDVGVWFQRMLTWYEQRGTTQGPVFLDERGNRCRTGYHEFAILTQFEWLQANVDDLISPNVNVFEDMGVGRGFRRGSNGQAVIQGVSQAWIDMNNRWSICERASEQAKGNRMNLSMSAHYSDIRLMLVPLLQLFNGVVGRDAFGRDILALTD
jgi:hypothetical protein